MDRKSLGVVNGGLQRPVSGHWHSATGDAVSDAIRSGFRVGRRVRIGRVPGRVVGYNIGTFGRFCGATYPLLVKTEFGLAKCSVSELDWFD